MAVVEGLQEEKFLKKPPNVFIYIIDEHSEK